MSLKMRTFTRCSSALAALLLLVVSLSTCESTLGFGNAIDFEPPVLELISPTRNPSYVYKSTELMGNVTDNISVDRVILRHAVSGILLGTAELAGDGPRSKSWVIAPDFASWGQLLGFEDIDGEKIPVEIVAYDTSGNSGDTSIRAISLIIDLSEPVVDNVWITRTSMKEFYPEPLGDLRQLETTDPKGEASKVNDTGNKYQNGWFYIDARLTEEITTIDRVKLQIFDSRYPDTPMLPEDEDFDPENPPLFEGKKRDDGTTVTAPRWTIKEEDLIARGEALGFPNYTTSYYAGGERYYYQIAIIAHDKSKNEGKWKWEDKAWFVMWERGDEPKGFLDPVVLSAEQGEGDSSMITKGDMLPVEFFDDDSLGWAYTGLFTLDQWKGYDATNSAVYLDDAKTLQMPDGSNDVKLEWLKQKLVDEGKTILNWKLDKPGYTTGDEIKELLGGKHPDEKTEYIQTGVKDEDYGEYVLFTLVQDQKLAPHDNTGPQNTNRARWKGKSWRITAIDDQIPMIIFDTEDRGSGPTFKRGSPEENTFPILDDGRYFTIHGYTLRQSETTDTVKKVEKLRMAWIPYGKFASTQDIQNIIQDMAKSTFTPPAGVQSWELNLTDPSGTPEYETIGNGSYRKQYFTKTFDVLGASAADPVNGIPLADYRNPPAATPKILKNAVSDITNETHFVYEGNLENETKLFVLVAIDNMGHDVDKQLPILGRTTPPKMIVYDISDRRIPTGTTLTDPPDINDPKYIGLDGRPSASGRIQYQEDLKAYNETVAVYNALNTIATSGSEPLEEAEPLQTYPRGKTLRYWVQADETGDIAIQTITMQDTSGGGFIGYYHPTRRRLTFAETLPEVTQRVFLFIATDTLGNEAKVQRTAAITNASMLTGITSSNPDATYGISINTNNSVPADEDDRITIHARFSNLIQWEGTNPPLLNVRYKNASSQYVLRQIPTITPRSPSVLSLEFKFSVPQGAGGELETMYDDSSMTYAVLDGGGSPVGDYNRPITLPSGTRILDVSEGATSSVPAFVPGYTSGSTRMETWRTDKGSLQKEKDLMLDGVRPNLIVVSNNAYLPVSGKNPFTTGGGDFYFKSNETITFTLKADKRIQPSGSGNPRIQFYVGNTITSGNTIEGPYYANYVRSPDTTTMIFSCTVSSTITRDGVIVTNSATTAYNVRINTEQGGIEDIVGNAVSQLVNNTGVVQTSSPVPTPVFPASPATTVYIDQGAPAAPQTFLRNSSNVNQTDFTGANATAGLYNFILNLHFADFTPPTTDQWNAGYTKWYSTNGGLSWLTYTGSAGVSIENNGTYNLMTRYVDRAGNEGATSSKTVTINAEFPKLLGVTAVQANGTYNRGKSLAFNLDFADTVSINTTAAVSTLSITLADMTTTTNNPDGTPNTYEITLNRNNAALAANGKTITFTWNSVNGKDMLNGLKVTAMALNGLRDQFGNNGPAAITATATAVNIGTQSGVPTPGYSVAYNLNGIIVSGIGPRVTAYSPVNAEGRTGNVTTSVSSDNKTISLTFSKPMQKGNGTITVRPRGNYAIPAVLENAGYYLTVTFSSATPPVQTETRSSTAGTDSIYVSGMSDIFNNITSAQDRAYLIGDGTSTTHAGGKDLANPELSLLTGLSKGPYKKMTHGLRTGAGYTGSYDDTTPGQNAPSPTTNTTNAYMIPDTTTKWVLNYEYEIHNATANSAVSNIRGALTRMGYRRQQIAVTSTNVSVSGNVATITLNEPLLPGLQWDLFYGEGTFTDVAGNSAAALTDGAYWFWSKGIQKPVIRVDRKSSDARSTVPIRTSGNTNTQAYNANGYSSELNTNIGNFNTINYRIETETPTARLYHGQLLGTSFTTTYGGQNNVTIGSVTGAWTGSARVGTYALPTGTYPNPLGGAAINRVTNGNIGNLYWNGNNGATGNNNRKSTANVTVGVWLRPNLVFRNRNNGETGLNDKNYEYFYEITENGITSKHAVRGTNGYYGFRSFNKDAQEDNLTGILLSSNTTVPYGTDFFSYDALQASKNYVAAEARIDHVNNTYTSATYTSPKGYEGVYRTVVALNQLNAANGQTTRNGNVLLCGTNIKSGIPTIAGFPLKDGVANSDTRYLKVFHFDGTARYYWVSSEIVTPWYLQQHGYGGGGSYGNAGDTWDWITAGYGDLSYALDVNVHGQ